MVPARRSFMAKVPASVGTFFTLGYLSRFGWGTGSNVMASLVLVSFGTLRRVSSHIVAGLRLFGMLFVVYLAGNPLGNPGRLNVACAM